MLTYIKAENLKNRHTVTAKLFWIVPLVSIVLAFIFCGQDVRYYQINQFNWWYTTLFPMLLLLSTAFVGQRERKIKNRAMGTLPVDIEKLWAAKVFYSFQTLVFAVLILFCAEEVLSRVLASGLERDISTISVLVAVVLWLILSAWQIPLWAFVNQKFGFATEVLLGLGGNVVLGILGALSKWWMLNPFSYINRLMCPVLKILPNSLPAEPGSQTFYPELLGKAVIPIGIGCSLLLFFICYTVTLKLYQAKGEKGWEN